MNSKRPVPIFFKKRDIALILLVLAASALLFFLFWPRIFANEAVAVVSVGVDENQTTQRILLSEDRLVSIEGAALPVTLSVEGGGIRFVNSVCPDHLCEGFGLLQHEGDWASCLPAEVFVRIESGG